jgi:hypothetical protein
VPSIFDVQHGNLGTGDMRQIELHGLIDLRLFAPGDISANRRRMAFDCLAGYTEPRQQVHLFPAMIKRGIAAHHCHHAADTGRILGVLNVEFPVAWDPALVTARTVVVGALEGDRADCRQQLP